MSLRSHPKIVGYAVVLFASRGTSTYYVPEGLRTKTQLGKMGLRLAPGQVG